jgi:hypothetical protein
VKAKFSNLVSFPQSALLISQNYILKILVFPVSGIFLMLGIFK